MSFRYLEQTALQELNALFERMRTQPFDSRTRVEIEEKSLRPAMEPHAATHALLRELEEAGKQVGAGSPLVDDRGGGSDGKLYLVSRCSDTGRMRTLRRGAAY